MHTISVAWVRFLQIVAFVAVGVAAFEAGLLWQARQGQRKPSAPVSMAVRASRSPATSSIVKNSIRAEFNPQSALLIGANGLVVNHQSAFKDIARAVHNHIPIIGFVNDDDEVELGQELLTMAGLPIQAVHFIKYPLDTMWMRDFGPLFARWSDGAVKIVHPIYKNTDTNDPRVRDDSFAMYLGKTLNLEVERLPLVIEGGNILSNGDGLMVTSTRVVERPENSRYTVQQISDLLQTHLGCRIWVCLRPLEGEPTGHIDFCLTFLRRNLVVVGTYDPAYDRVNAAILDDMAKSLAGQATSMGPMVVERIPMPPRSKEGDWRSYCNILIVNGVILMPSFNEVDPAMETQARDTYARLMPSWKIASIPSDTLIKQRGILHCVGITVPGYVNVTPLINEAM